MSRVEQIEQSRADMAELTAKFGLAMKDSNGAPLIDKAMDLKLARTILSPPKTVFPVRGPIKRLRLFGPVSDCSSELAGGIDAETQINRGRRPSAIYFTFDVCHVALHDR